VLCCNYTIGFEAVEFGADITASCSKEELVAAKEKADVEVVGLCGINGRLYAYMVSAIAIGLGTCIIKINGICLSMNVLYCRLISMSIKWL